MLRFTFVVARYGAEVLGGAEKHARDVAEHLAARGHDVQVHTTCATSYVTWRNVLPPGTSELSGVKIHRHPTTIPRLRPLDEVLKASTSALPNVQWLTRAWAVAQGPNCPSLLDALARESDHRDMFVFFSLLSRLTFEGLERVAARSALVPLVHEEPPIYTRVARNALTRPRTLLLNTEEEAQRVVRVVGTTTPPIGIVAVGREDPPCESHDLPRPTPHPYVVILGRHGKTKPMLPVWRRLVTATELPPLEYDGALIPWSDVRLVTVGELSPLYRGVPNVVPIGFVGDVERWHILRGAVALFNPSRYESLSLVLLEAWTCGVPVVVNEACDVTVGQCTRSGGGVPIDFVNTDRGAKQLAESLRSAGRRREMGARGHAYVHGRYRWDRVAGAYERVARALRDGADIRTALGDCAYRHSPAA